MWSEPQGSGELIGQRGSGLQGGALASGRTTEQVAYDGSTQDERRHPDRNDGLWIVNFVEQEIVASLHGLAELAVNQAHEEPGDRQEGNDPEVRLAECRSPLQRSQQCGGRSPGKRANCNADGGPAQKIA